LVSLQDDWEIEVVPGSCPLLSLSRGEKVISFVK